MQMRRERGVALVELALIVPLVMALVFITTEFGRAYYEYNTIAKSVREAARYLSVRVPGVDVAKAKNIVVYGNPAGQGTPVLRGLSLSNVPDPTYGVAGSFPALSTVTITVTGYTFKPMFTQVFGLSLTTIAFSPISATMRSPS
jgi:hypothetical protein